MFAELMTVINALISAAKITLSQKDRRAIEKKVREASHIIENATQKEILAYDPRVRDLLEAVEKDVLHRARARAGRILLGTSRKSRKAIRHKRRKKATTINRGK